MVVCALATPACTREVLVHVSAAEATRAEPELRAKRAVRLETTEGTVMKLDSPKGGGGSRLYAFRSDADGTVVWFPKHGGMALSRALTAPAPGNPLEVWRYSGPPPPWVLRERARLPRDANGALLGGTWTIEEPDTTPRSKAGRILAIVGGAGAGATAYALILTTILVFQDSPPPALVGAWRAEGILFGAFSSMALIGGAVWLSGYVAFRKKDGNHLGDGVFRF
jgi:hypothetical protein